MNTKIIRLKYLITAILICLISENVWGQAIFNQVDFRSTKSKDKNLPNGWTGSVGGTYTSPFWQSFRNNNDYIQSPEFTVCNKITISFDIYLNNTGTSGNKSSKIKFEALNGTNVVAEETSEELNSMPTGASKFKTITSTLSGEGINQIKLTFLKDGGGNVAFSILNAEVTSLLAKPEFKYNNENITINLGETFTPPRLTNTSDGIVTYTSSNTELATITNDGTVTLAEGIAGKATITASVAKTETYAAASASYTLTVIDPNNQIITLDFENDNWGFPSEAGDGNATFNNLTCTFKKGRQITNYIYIAKDGELTLPIFSDKIVKSIKLTTSASIGSTVIVSLYAGTNVVTNNNSIGTKNKTFTFDIPSNFQGTNMQYKFTPTTGNMQTIKIEMECKQLAPSSTTDPTTKSMTLTGAWTAEGLAALDLTGINSLDMTGISIPTGVTLSDTRNPNCIVYTSFDDMEKAETLPNAVIVDESGSIALDKGIQLTDGNDFHNKIAFSGAISYTRTFETGWNTFALPFPATIEAGDEVEEFDSMKDGKTIQFKKATTIAANAPYLINIATAGEKTFTATSADVPVTASTGDIYKSCFTKLTGDDMNGKYILVLEGDKEVFAPATTGATLPAFRGYLELPQVTGIRYSIAHDQGGATNIETNNEGSANIYTENGILNIHTNVAQAIQIRSIDGRTIQSIQLAENTDIQINNLAKGIYLINNRKVIIK